MQKVKANSVTIESLLPGIAQPNGSLIRLTPQPGKRRPEHPDGEQDLNFKKARAEASGQQAELLERFSQFPTTTPGSLPELERHARDKG